MAKVIINIINLLTKNRKDMRKTIFSIMFAFVAAMFCACGHTAGAGAGECDSTACDSDTVLVDTVDSVVCDTVL